MHKNSRESYEKCKEDDNFTRIVYRIARFYEERNQTAYTDREVRNRMFSCGSIPNNDMNMVRPKITNLIREGFLEETGKTLDKVTDRTVRKVRWRNGNVIEKVMETMCCPRCKGLGTIERQKGE